MRVLITGGAGFIGIPLVKHYEKVADVVVLDNFRSGSMENLRRSRCSLIEDTVEDENAVRKACRGIDIIFHLAGMSNVAESLRHPEECFRLNVAGTLNILRAAVATTVKRIVFASSASVYVAAAMNLPRNRDHLRSMTPYAISKLRSERYCRAFSWLHNLQVVCLRYFNVYGPQQKSDAVIPTFFERARKNLCLHIHGDGMQTRDFIHVQDVVRATVIAASRGVAGGIYDVGSGTSVSIQSVARRIIDLTSSSSEVLRVAPRRSDIRDSRAHVFALHNCGFRSRISLDDGLAQLAGADHPHVAMAKL